jgi:hypothetical protein
VLRQAREDAAGQRVVAVVCNGQRGLEVRRMQRGKNRREDFHARQPMVRLDAGEDGRPEVVPACRCLALENQHAFRAADLEIALRLVQHLLVDQRAEAVLGIGRWPQRPARQRIGQPRQQVFVHAPFGDQTRSGGTLLSLVAECGRQNVHHRLVEIGILVNDDRVLAAHFAHHAFDAPLLRAAPVRRVSHGVYAI